MSLDELVKGDNYIFPVSALRQPYTSPKPPRPIIRCTEKSFTVKCILSSKFFHWQNRVNLSLKYHRTKKINGWSWNKFKNFNSFNCPFHQMYHEISRILLLNYFTYSSFFSKKFLNFSVKKFFLYILPIRCWIFFI